MISKKNIFVK